MNRKELKRIIIETTKGVLKTFIDLGANFFTRLLIWVASTLYLIECGQEFLGFLLLISGLAYIYKLSRSSWVAIKQRKQDALEEIDGK